MSKIYDLSKQNQMADKRRILIADSGKEYDVSFVPAIINRKYYKVWIENQTDIIKIYDKYLKAYKKVSENTQDVTREDIDAVDELNRLTKEAAASGINLVIATIKANGYEDFDEDELLNNFSELAIAEAINFIMGRVDPENKKKEKTKKAN